VDPRNPPEDGRDRTDEPGKDGLHGIFQSRLDHQKKFFPGMDRSEAGANSVCAGLRSPMEGAPPAFRTSRGSVAQPVSSPTVGFPASVAADATHEDPAHRPALSSWERKKLTWSDGPPQSLTAGGGALSTAGRSAPARPLGIPTGERESDTHDDRRGSFRYAVDGVCIAIGWPMGPSNLPSGQPPTAHHRNPQDPGLPHGQLVLHEAAVVDISQSGLCLMLSQLPPRDRGLWVGIGGGDPACWSGVVLRSLAEPRPGQFLLRLSFVKDCPYELFKYVVLQPTPDRVPE
jgi:hypothetical protein